MIICDICKKETLMSYAVTVKGYADVELCAECQAEIEVEAWEQETVQLTIEAAKRIQKDFSWKEMTEDEFLTALKGEMEKLIKKYGRG